MLFCLCIASARIARIARDVRELGTNYAALQKVLTLVQHAMESGKIISYVWVTMSRSLDFHLKIKNVPLGDPK